MSDRAAEGAAVTDLRVADMTGRMGQQWYVLLEER